MHVPIMIQSIGLNKRKIVPTKVSVQPGKTKRIKRLLISRQDPGKALISETSLLYEKNSQSDQLDEHATFMIEQTSNNKDGHMFIKEEVRSQRKIGSDWAEDSKKADILHVEIAEKQVT